MNAFRAPSHGEQSTVPPLLASTIDSHRSNGRGAKMRRPSLLPLEHVGQANDSEIDSRQRAQVARLPCEARSCKRERDQGPGTDGTRRRRGEKPPRLSREGQLGKERQMTNIATTDGRNGEKITQDSVSCLESKIVLLPIMRGTAEQVEDNICHLPKK